MNRTSKTAGGLLLLATLLACQGAAAYQANISADSRALYLRVGTGSMTSALSYNQGARPVNNTTVQTVLVNVPAGQIGNGKAMGNGAAMAAIEIIGLGDDDHGGASQQQAQHQVIIL